MIQLTNFKMKDRRLMFIIHFPRKLKLTQINCDVKVSKMISYQLYMGNDNSCLEKFDLIMKFLCNVINME